MSGEPRTWGVLAHVIVALPGGEYRHADVLSDSDVPTTVPPGMVGIPVSRLNNMRRDVARRLGVPVRDVGVASFGVVVHDEPLDVSAEVPRTVALVREDDRAE